MPCRRLPRGGTAKCQKRDTPRGEILILYRTRCAPINVHWISRTIPTLYLNMCVLPGRGTHITSPHEETPRPGKAGHAPQPAAFLVWRSLPSSRCRAASFGSSTPHEHPSKALSRSFRASATLVSAAPAHTYSIHTSTLIPHCRGKCGSTYELCHTQKSLLPPSRALIRPHTLHTATAARAAKGDSFQRAA